MAIPENWLEICSAELKRGGLVSYPLKCNFMMANGFKDIEELHAWMKKTRRDFEDMVLAAQSSNVEVRGK